MEKITIVVCSKHTKDEKKNFCDNVNNTCGIEHDLVFITNKDGVGLSQIYHEIINDINDNFIVFIHDDIEFLRYGWGSEIVRLFNENNDYGIIGVAGSAEFDEEAAWWRYNQKYGQVIHRSATQSWLTAFSELLPYDLEEVCVVDGLFIAINKNKIKINFDNSLTGFHMYDVDFCLANFITNSVKIGVTTNIRIAHNSIGEIDENWALNRDYINSKYHKYYPIKINKK